MLKRGLPDAGSALNAPIDSQKPGPGKIHLEYFPILIKGKVSRRRKIIQIGITASRNLKLSLCPPEFLILHLEFGLVCPELRGPFIYLHLHFIIRLPERLLGLFPFAQVGNDHAQTGFFIDEHFMQGNVYGNGSFLSAHQGEFPGGSFPQAVREELSPGLPFPGGNEAGE